jgi:hypothetical protein
MSKVVLGHTYAVKDHPNWLILTSAKLEKSGWHGVVKGMVDEQPAGVLIISNAGKGFSTTDEALRAANQIAIKKSSDGKLPMAE